MPEVEVGYCAEVPAVAWTSWIHPAGSCLPPDSCGLRIKVYHILTYTTVFLFLYNKLSMRTGSLFLALSNSRTHSEALKKLAIVHFIACSATVAKLLFLPNNTLSSFIFTISIQISLDHPLENPTITNVP